MHIASQVTLYLLCRIVINLNGKLDILSTFLQHIHKGVVWYLSLTSDTTFWTLYVICALLLTNHAIFSASHFFIFFSHFFWFWTTLVCFYNVRIVWPVCCYVCFSHWCSSFPHLSILLTTPASPSALRFCNI